MYTLSPQIIPNTWQTSMHPLLAFVGPCDDFAITNLSTKNDRLKLVTERAKGNNYIHRHNDQLRKVRGRGRVYSWALMSQKLSLNGRREHSLKLPPATAAAIFSSPPHLPPSVFPPDFLSPFASHSENSFAVWKHWLPPIVCGAGLIWMRGLFSIKYTSFAIN